MSRSKKKKIGGYTPADLGSKIDNEGGIEEFFNFYSSPESFRGSVIEKEVFAFCEAYENLREALEKAGVTGECGPVS
jgi:hypothetical protein